MRLQLIPERRGAPPLRMLCQLPRRARWLAIAAFALMAAGRADVLPEDRSDLLFHRYSGGGITVQGPSVLIRKKIGDSVSLVGLSPNGFLDRAFNGHFPDGFPIGAACQYVRPPMNKP